jgi:hypothetical protein
MAVTAHIVIKIFIADTLILPISTPKPLAGAGPFNLPLSAGKIVYFALLLRNSNDAAPRCHIRGNVEPLHLIEQPPIADAQQLGRPFPVASGLLQGVADGMTLGFSAEHA